MPTHESAPPVPHEPQSAGHEAHDSETAQVPSPQPLGHAPQSVTQFVHVSVGAVHFPSPHLGPQLGMVVLTQRPLEQVSCVQSSLSKHSRLIEQHLPCDLNWHLLLTQVSTVHATLSSQSPEDVQQPGAFWYTQSLFMHASFVHAFKSLQSASTLQQPSGGLTCWHTPLWHVSTVHLVESSHSASDRQQSLFAGVFLQAYLSQTSVVQLMPSLQSVLTPQQPEPVEAVWTHLPFWQASLLHAVPSLQSLFLVQHSGLVVNVHRPPAHLPVVQTLPSSQLPSVVHLTNFW